MDAAPDVRRVAVAAVSCVMGLIPAGCQGTWEAYEQIVVGEPVPQAGPFAKSARRGGFEWVWQDGGCSGFPATAAESSVRTVHDGRGNVVAKEYRATAAGHWLLVQTSARRCVIETRVPEHAWRDPPTGWTPPSPGDPAAWERGRTLLSALDALSSETGSSGCRQTTGPDVRDSLEGNTILGIHACPISPRRVARRIMEQVDGAKTGVRVDVGRDIDFDGIAVPEGIDWSDVPARICLERPAPGRTQLVLEIAVPATARPATNVLEWLALVTEVSDRRLPEPDPAGSDASSGGFPGILEPVYMCGRVGAIDLRDLAGMPECFRGATREGFDRTYGNAWGATCRIQNLGNRRLRVETNRFEILDGLSLLGYLKLALRSDY